MSIDDELRQIDNIISSIDSVLISNKYLRTGMAIGLGLKHESDMDSNYLSIGQMSNELNNCKNQLKNLKLLIERKKDNGSI